jgi:[ribosomal protein S18]-alanine N-acetyltransferase
MPVEIVVGQATPSDAERMASIHENCFPRPWDEVTMGRFARSGGDVLCLLAYAVASSAANSGGFLIVRKAADEAELLTLAVAPACRRLGMGKALLKAAMEILRDSGAKQLFLEVEEGNEAALRLYRSLGAVPVGRRARYYEHGADAAIFSLAL